MAFIFGDKAGMSQPLILTLRLDKAAQTFYEDLRLRYFPPDRNLTPAHLTLFHHLPDEELIYRTIEEVASARTNFALREATPRSIGRGVAVFFRSEKLAALHASLSIAFEPCLIPQDRQRFQPHVVVQNKVDPGTARQTLALLQAGPLIEPYATGLTLWRYLGGPWERVSDLAFADSAEGAEARP